MTEEAEMDENSLFFPIVMQMILWSAQNMLAGS